MRVGKAIGAARRRGPDGVPTGFSNAKWWARRKGAFAHPTRGGADRF
jgi:hypothetical protein